MKITNQLVCLVYLFSCFHCISYAAPNKNELNFHDWLLAWLLTLPRPHVVFDFNRQDVLIGSSFLIFYSSWVAQLN